MPYSDEFARLTYPYRAELVAHCYRMLGSVHDAEDLVQETYIRAWRAFGQFEGRTSVRRWLYRIATNRCLTALENRSRRPMPSGLGAPDEDPRVPPAPARAEIPWLEPLPDPVLRTDPADPATIVVTRDSVRLALVAALQHLPARQRAVLLLREVLGWRAAEVAELLGTTTTAVNSLLQRARTQLDAVRTSEHRAAPQASEELIGRYIRAFETQDMALFSRLLADDAIAEMPPSPSWYTGRDAIVQFLALNCFPVPGTIRMFPVIANGQPAVASYILGEHGTHNASSIHVLTVTGRKIAHIATFFDPSLFALFGLPGTLSSAERHGELAVAR